MTFARENRVLDEVDRAIERLLKREMPSFGRDKVEVSFAAPDGHFSVKLPAVDLFLYDLRENLELRSNDETIEYVEDGCKSRVRAPVVRIDASYLITAWPGGQQADSPSDEHRLLGAVMLTLLRFRKLPRDLLGPRLADAGLPLPVTVLQPGRLQSVGEFWQALGGKPKAALNYTVTFPVDADAGVAEWLVTDRELRLWPTQTVGAPG